MLHLISYSLLRRIRAVRTGRSYLTMLVPATYFEIISGLDFQIIKAQIMAEYSRSDRIMHPVRKSQYWTGHKYK